VISDRGYDSEQPWLIPWYEEHGFKVTPPDADAVRGAANMVVWRR
jgi:hypothetical protein